MEEKLYTVQELEKIFTVSRQAVWSWIKKDKLKAFKAGKFWRIKESSLKKFMENRK